MFVYKFPAKFLALLAPNAASRREHIKIELSRRVNVIVVERVIELNCATLCFDAIGPTFNANRA